MGSRELTHISHGANSSGGARSEKGWYRSDAHGTNTSDDPASGWQINPDGTWTDPDGTSYNKDGWIDSHGYIHEANGDIVEPGPFGQDNIVVHPDGTYFDPGLPNGGGTVNPKTGSWVDANGAIHSPSGLILDQDGNTTSPDGQVQTSGGWTINSDGSWTDPDGNTYNTDGTWTDRDGNLHFSDGTWTDKDGVTHYDNGDTSFPGPFGGSYVYHQDGSWTDPDGTQHNSDGTIHTGFTMTPVDTTGDAVDVVTGAGDVGGDDSNIYDTSSAEGDLGTSASTDASDIYDVSPTDDGSSSGDSSSDDSSSDDDHHGDDNTDDQTAGPADPPAPDDGGPTGGSDSDPEGDGEERPGLGHHARPARGTTPAGHGTVASGDTDIAGGGYGWTHFGAPRSDDGDNGDEKPSLGHHSTRHDSGHGPHLPGSGLQGSTGDSDYVGGGYGWNLHGAPRADTAAPGIGDSVGPATTGLAGQGISTGGGLTVDSAPLPDGAGPERHSGRRSRYGRARLLVSAGLLLALPLGALALTFGGTQPPDGPTTSPVASTTAAAPTSAIVPRNDSMPIPTPLPQATDQTTPPAPVVITTQTVPVTTTATSAPTPADETTTAPTTSAKAPTTTITTAPRAPIILPPSVIAPIPVIPVMPNHHSAPGGSTPHVSTDSVPHNIDGAPRQRTITHHGS